MKKEKILALLTLFSFLPTISSATVVSINETYINNWAIWVNTQTNTWSVTTVTLPYAQPVICGIVLNKTSYRVWETAMVTWSWAVWSTQKMYFNTPIVQPTTLASSGSYSFKVWSENVKIIVSMNWYNEYNQQTSYCSASANVILPTPSLTISANPLTVSRANPTTTISWTTSGASYISSSFWASWTNWSKVVTPVVSNNETTYILEANRANWTKISKNISIKYITDSTFSSGSKMPYVYPNFKYTSSWSAISPNTQDSAWANGVYSLPYSLWVVVNENDPLSSQIANYYISAHKLSTGSIFRIKLPYWTWITNVSANDFALAYKSLQDQIGTRNIQMLALTWATPWKVNWKISITSAFAFGTGVISEFLENPLYNSESNLPYNTTKIRPTMSVAALTFDEAKKLIDRWVKARFTKVSNYNPDISAYFVRTSDNTRSLRDWLDNWPNQLAPWLGRYIKKSSRIQADYLTWATNIMFYFTSLRSIKYPEQNTYAPWAVADHLTSCGWMLTLPCSWQMSSLRWLEAWATASYGTVVEPFAYEAKFPKASIMVKHYMAWEPVWLAYFKSVKRPAQGIFIWDPLAMPFWGYQYFNDWDKTYLNYFGWTTLSGATLYIPAKTSYSSGKYIVTPEKPINTITPFIPGKQDFVIPNNLITSNSYFMVWNLFAWTNTQVWLSTSTGKILTGTTTPVVTKVNTWITDPTTIIKTITGTINPTVSTSTGRVLTGTTTYTGWIITNIIAWTWTTISPAIKTTSWIIDTSTEKVVTGTIIPIQPQTTLPVNTTSWAFISTWVTSTTVNPVLPAGNVTISLVADLNDYIKNPANQAKDPTSWITTVKLPAWVYIVKKPVILESNFTLNWVGTSTVINIANTFTGWRMFTNKAYLTYTWIDSNITISNLQINVPSFGSWEVTSDWVMRFGYVNNFKIDNIQVNANTTRYLVDFAMKTKNISIINSKLINWVKWGWAIMIRNMSSDLSDAATSSNILIENNVMNSAVVDEPLAVYGWLWRTENVVVNKNTITVNDSSYGITVYNTSPTSFTAGSKWTVSNVKLTNNIISGWRVASIGIMAWANNVEVSTNTITNKYWNGISIHKWSLTNFPNPKDIRILNNKISDITRNGIFASWDAVIIKNNSITNCTVAGLSIGDNMVIESNTINWWKPAIRIWGKWNQVINNIIYWVINSAYPSENTLTGNTLISTSNNTTTSVITTK